MSPVWLFGIFFITAIDLTVARNDRLRRIMEYENAICEPRKRFLDYDGCSSCVCRFHGYGSICEKLECKHVKKRPVDARECKPYGEFTTACHYCKCSSTGIPIDCVDRRRTCMDEILDALENERFSLVTKIIEPSDKYLFN